ncbi:hypothetical protein [Rhodococcus sp. SGAir0479]|uniref:hypothetical protein n=1 Tax=Rhodococcus sp. SGAir0479 TaxID=2567884 RepID=UPI0010CD450F|nr:hypothetical protein [Rhodococcus sp. SGAir0479]QCQ91750.1 hypothetical protein E7742_11250 [Rhodococcus sp. SGAir0479]
MRRFLTVRRFEDGPQLFAGHLETIIRKPNPEFSARFHVGTAASETPFDGHLTILGSGIYWGTENGRKLAAWLTREERHPWDGRDLSVRIHNGRAYLSAWVHPDNWVRGEFAQWRSGSWLVSPLDHFYGPARYWHADVDRADLVVELPEGAYPVTATLQRQTYGRPKSRRRTESWVVNVESPNGIPNRRDRSGGWKGDRAYGFGVALASRRPDWDVDAKAAIAARILKDRADSGFREPQPTSGGGN